MQSKFAVKIKLMRLPFVAASIIPYLIGAGYVFRGGQFNIFNIRFFIGLCAVVCGHIGANIFNDYFDSKSGNDWQDPREHLFFGGSKIIQKGLLGEKEVFRTASAFMIASALFVVALQVMLPKIPIVIFGACVLILAFFYTSPPLKLVYRGWGELAIFILFGTAIVTGSYVILTGKYFGIREILLSLPISFLVTAILYSNEVPDYPVDRASGKNNLVVRIGPAKAWLGYFLLILGALASMIICVVMRILPAISLPALILFALYAKPLRLIKEKFNDIELLKNASRLTIMGHALIGAGMICALFASGVTETKAHRIEYEEYKETRLCLGAYATIHCFYDKKIDMAEVSRRCWNRIDQIQKEMDARTSAVTGDISRINASGGDRFEVSDDVFRVLEDAVKFSRLTNGAFDVTVQPLIELWKDADRRGQLPDKESLKNARDKIGYENIILEAPNRLIFKKPGMKIDLGGIAKGFTSDEVAKILRKNGIRDFFVASAGDIFCSGAPPGKKAWEIGIQDPKNKSKIIGTINLRNRGVSTSGNYERFVTIGGERFSHIIDPRTGYPQKYVISATVIAPSNEETDSLATALCILGGGDGTRLIESLKDTAASVVEERDGKLIMYDTKNFKNYRSHASLR